jgi:phage gp36-like protein
VSYASPADMLKRYDTRTLGELVSDSGSRVSAAALLTDANLAAALEDASGEIDAHVLQGDRYTTAQLAELTGNSKAYLVRICCAVALSLLWERRPYQDSDEGVGAEQAALQARKVLSELKKGEQIFDLPDVRDAGLPSSSVPSRVTLDAMNLAVDRARGHFYPRRLLPGETGT